MNKLKTALAYTGIYLISAADSVRYSIGWIAWGLITIATVVASFYFFIKGDWRSTLQRFGVPLWTLLAIILASITWSNYPLQTLIGFAVVIAGTSFALFLIQTYSWRQLLSKFANSFRFILVISILFELFAALIVRGPIDPIFKDFQGSYQTQNAYRWTLGRILRGGRIQGIMGNANLLAYVAMLALILFLVQYAIRMTGRWLSLSSIALAIACLALTTSATIAFALLAVALSALVLIITEGRSQPQRHRVYRLTWTALALGGFVIALYSSYLSQLVGKSPDMTGRADLWAAVSSVISQRPLLGWGWLSYWMPGAKPFDGLFFQAGVTYYQAHNIYLDFWAQLGIIGLIAFLAVALTSFVKLWRLASRSSNPLYLWPVFVFVGLLFQNLFESRLIIELGWVLFIIGTVKVNEPAETDESTPELSKREALGVLGRRLLGRGW